MDNVNANDRNNQTEPKEVLQRAQEALDALFREADSLGEQRRQVQEDTMAVALDEAIASGDVRGAMSTAMRDTEELDRRAAELPFELHAAQLVVFHAQAAVHEHDRARFAAELEEVMPQVKPAREKAEAAQAEFDEIWSRYQHLETSEDRALIRKSEVMGQAGRLRERGPSLAPLGGVPSPLGEAVDRRNSMRNIRNPNRTGVKVRRG